MNRTHLRERVQQLALIGAVYGAGVISANIYNHTATLPQIESAAAAAPKLAREAQVAQCNQKADEKVAKQAILSANSDTVPVPDTKALNPCKSAQVRDIAAYGGAQ